MDILFLLSVAVLLAGHELDAIRQAEWRFFFAALPVSDQTAYRLFVALHVPLVAVILWAWPARSFQLGFDLFLIGHAGLHWLLRRHPLVSFNGWFSRLWIFGGAVLGAGHLVLLFWPE